MQKFPLIIYVVLIVLALGTFARAEEAASPETATAPSADAPEPSPAATELKLASAVAIVPLHNEIDYGLQRSLERRVEQAIADKVDLIVFEMDTYGGRLDSGSAMGDYIDAIKTRTGGKVKTVAYVRRNAISAGALISLACQQIVMNRGSTLGDCQAIMINPQTQQIEVAPEKQQTYVRTLMRKYAQSNGYSELLAEAMVDPSFDIYQIRHKDGRTDYVTGDRWDEMTDAEKEGIEKKLILPKGRLLTMSDTEAKEYGFSRATVDGLDGALALYATPGATRMRMETTWSEELVRFLNSAAVTSILMIVGIFALYMAFKTPGLGVAEGLAMLCFATLFMSKYLVGLSSVADILLFVIGISLIAVEVFILPGFGVVGAAGLLCVIASLILSLQKFTIPEYDFEFSILLQNLLIVIGSLLASTLVFMLVARFLPNTPLLRRLILMSAQTPELGYVVGSASQRELAGSAGVALSTLRPAGRAEIGGKIMDVVADGDFIEAGEKIIISEVRGNRIVVRRA